MSSRLGDLSPAVQSVSMCVRTPFQDGLNLHQRAFKKDYTAFHYDLRDLYKMIKMCITLTPLKLLMAWK